jgi:DNA-binding phage protein
MGRKSKIYELQDDDGEAFLKEAARFYSSEAEEIDVDAFIESLLSSRGPRTKEEIVEAIIYNVSRLIVLRKYRTVELFAHENELSKSTLSQALSGSRLLNLETLVKIAVALDVDVRVLITMPSE